MYNSLPSFFSLSSFRTAYPGYFSTHRFINLMNNTIDQAIRALRVLFKGPFHPSELPSRPSLFRSFLCPILARMSSIRMYVYSRNEPSTISFRQSVSLILLANAVESSTCLFPPRYLSRHVARPRFLSLIVAFTCRPFSTTRKPHSNVQRNFLRA